MSPAADSIRGNTSQRLESKPRRRTNAHAAAANVQRILAERQARSLSVLKKLGDWLKAESPRVLPKNPIREAMDYARNNWTALNQYVRHGHLAIDNDVAE